MCIICLPSLPLKEGKVCCPSCRKLSSYEEHIKVTYTEVGRWDALLKVAEEWANVDTKDVDVNVDDPTDDEEMSSSSEGEENDSDNNRLLISFIW